MGYLVHLGSKDDASARGRGAERQPLSPEQRRTTGILAAVILARTVAVGIQAAPAVRAALFPVASVDAPADADPGAVPTLDNTGVYDRRVPGAVVVAGGNTPQAPAPVDDPSERPFQRGAGR